MLNGLIFLFCSALSIFVIIVQENCKRAVKITFPSVIFFLIPMIIFSLSRILWAETSGLADYHNYMLFFNHADKVIENRFEPAAKVIRSISPAFWIFLLIHSLFSISLKLYAIKKIAVFPLLSLITYLSTSFALHDIVQIRISCAIAIFLCAVCFLVEKKYAIYIFLVFIACCFHKSSFAFFVFLFFRKNSFSQKFWIFALALVYALAFLNINLTDLFAFILGKDSYYYLSILDVMNQNLDLFNMNQLLNIFIFLLLSINSKKFSAIKSFPLLMKIFFLSIAAYPLFSSVPIIASRFSEMLRPSIIFLLPLTVNIFRKKWIGYIFFLFMCFALSFLNNFYYSLVSI